MKVLLAMDAPKTREQLTIYARRYVPLFESLTMDGVDLHIALLGDGANAKEEIEKLVGTVHQLPNMDPSARGSMALPRVTRRIHRLAKELRPDIVEGSEPLPAIAAAIAGRRVTTPTITYRKHHGSRGLKLLIASRIAAKLADATIVTNRPMAENAVKDDHTSPERVLVARSGTRELRRIKDAEVVAARRRLGIGPDDKVVAAICRLRYEKGLDVLVDAIDRVHSQAVHLVIVGTGPEEERLREQAERCVNPAHIVGHQDDVALWFGLSTIVAIPSRTESFGRSTIEAMCTGRPIVASRVGGLPEAIVDGVTGLLVPAEDPDSLANAIEKLLADDDLSTMMGAAGRKRYEERYSMVSMARSWRAAWEEAQRLPKRRGPKR